MPGMHTIRPPEIRSTERSSDSVSLRWRSACALRLREFSRRLQIFRQILKDFRQCPKDCGLAPKNSGPAREKYGPVRERYGPVRENYGPARESYGPARQSYGQARESCGSARQSYGPARENYGLSLKNLRLARQSVSVVLEKGRISPPRARAPPEVLHTPRTRAACRRPCLHPHRTAPMVALTTHRRLFKEINHGHYESSHWKPRRQQRLPSVRKRSTRRTRLLDCEPSPTSFLTTRSPKG
jgi:hypothetical protein